RRRGRGAGAAEEPVEAVAGEHATSEQQVLIQARVDEIVAHLNHRALGRVAQRERDALVQVALDELVLRGAEGAAGAVRGRAGDLPGLLVPRSGAADAGDVLVEADHLDAGAERGEVR